MAKKTRRPNLARKRVKSRERIRVKPPVIRSIKDPLTIRPRKKPEEIKQIQENRLIQLRQYIKRQTIKDAYWNKKTIRTVKLPSEIKDTHHCQVKKAKARHEYFSMIKSGKGASRTNQKSNRFTVKC